MWVIIALGALLFLPTQTGALRQNQDEDRLEEESLEKVATVETPGEVCCCKVEETRCSGTARNGHTKRFHPPASPQGPEVTHFERASTHTCVNVPLCCHKFAGRCQSSGVFSNRYTMRVLPRLCDDVPPPTKDQVYGNPSSPRLFGKAAFFGALQMSPNRMQPGFMTRDYAILIDMSGSMAIREPVVMPEKISAQLPWILPGPNIMSRWEQVRFAMAAIVSKITQEDPNGATVFFFESKGKTRQYNHVRDVMHVDALFDEEAPAGRTYLHDALRAAMGETPNSRIDKEVGSIGLAHSILILLDGTPSDGDKVQQLIDLYTSEICRQEMLAITVVQVGKMPDGKDDASEAYFTKLREANARKFSTVDVVSTKDMNGLDFLQFVDESLAS